ncbi:MAG: hemolysin III family protein [Actinomycetota bacterium]|nr:hemolysin III family protein [Actinomycetota bacterium]
MLAVSATYHRWVHSLRAWAIWRHADHATIFATIGGTFTPLCLVAVGTSWAIALLITMWSLASLGAAMKVLAWRHADRVGAHRRRRRALRRNLDGHDVTRSTTGKDSAWPHPRRR